jgi:YNFM family putative membrane transporter
MSTSGPPCPERLWRTPRNRPNVTDRASEQVPVRSIALLAVVGFASQAQVRVTDSLLPQIASDFGSTVGTAAMVVAAYVVAHGSIQLVIGPVGDRFGKYRVVAVASAIASVLVMLCGLAQSLPELAFARLAAGASAGWVIPLSMAYVGDVTPYGQRQPVLGRYLSGQIFGQLFGQAAGGVLGDWFGWRNVFFILAALFALATAGLVYELLTNPRTQPHGRPAERSRGLYADYVTVLSGRWARVVILAVFLEAGFGWGTFAYVGADLHLRFGLGFTAVGMIVATFAIGGLIYASLVRQLVDLLGQRGLVIGGAGIVAIGYLVLAVGLGWWLAPIAVSAIGLGFYMLHNTLQTNATQMTPQARGTAVAIFSSAIYLGQTAGVAVAAVVVDRVSAVPLYIVTALALPVTAMWFARELQRRGQR